MRVSQVRTPGAVQLPLAAPRCTCRVQVQPQLGPPPQNVLGRAGPFVRHQVVHFDAIQTRAEMLAEILEAAGLARAVSRCRCRSGAASDAPTRPAATASARPTAAMQAFGIGEIAAWQWIAVSRPRWQIELHAHRPACPRHLRLRRRWVVILPPNTLSSGAVSESSSSQPVVAADRTGIAVAIVDQRAHAAVAPDHVVRLYLATKVAIRGRAQVIDFVAAICTSAGSCRESTSVVPIKV